MSYIFENIVKKTEGMSRGEMFKFISMKQEDKKSDIRNRKGSITFSHEYLRKHASEEELQALFSVFFPMEIVDNRHISVYDTITYYGYSPMFDIREECEPALKYRAIIENDGNHTFVSKMEKL
jgi:hypothetical protein